MLRSLNMRKAVALPGLLCWMRWMCCLTLASAATSNAGYCEPQLCALYNGTRVNIVPHIACGNAGAFAPECGAQPQLLQMSARRKALLLDMHNLARARIAAGELAGYKPAAHMPLVRWDDELARLAVLHVKRCLFTHDQCHNTPRIAYSGQNIGQHWSSRPFRSHSRRMKSFVRNWYREHVDANQTYIERFRPHPNGKKIGHFTLLISDRVRRIGCAALRYQRPAQPTITRLLMTCNYDYNNIVGEPVYESGPTASSCVYKRSAQHPALCDWT